MGKKKLSLCKRLVFTLLTLIFGFIFVFTVGEIAVRLFNPQVILDPRSNYSEKYGMLWPANKKIRNELPGQWCFTYTTNRHHNRGPAIDISHNYQKSNVIILGDSNAFGQGVNDNEEFASVMAKQLKEDFDIINLSNSGWGLTQEIRRYYDLGQYYKPKLVVLQFCRNDPFDNFLFHVTRIENEQFVFVKATNEISCFKKFLSNSILQKSSLYNLFRAFTRNYFFHNTIRENIEKESKGQFVSSKIDTEENFYNELLSLFAANLKKSGIHLIMISVNNELNEYPRIKQKVLELDSLGYLEYQETERWFRHNPEYSSPEGHRWGQKAHQIIGLELSKLIQARY